MFASLRLGAAAAAATLLVGTAHAGMAEGAYHCWFFTQPREALNVTITGPTTYTATVNGSSGDYALDGTSVTWVSGYMTGVMPDGFTTTYEVRNGVPTIAHISGRGAEAGFCQHADSAAGR